MINNLDHLFQSKKLNNIHIIQILPASLRDFVCIKIRDKTHHLNKIMKNSFFFCKINS